jgi:carboxypeptidase Q
VGIPGFQFIQDPMDYGTRTHHSNQDTYDRLSEDDLKQAATIVASFVYSTSQREEMIPRVELPKAQGTN